MRKVLWLVLIISTICVIPSINLRVSNEINNNSVLLAYDYQKCMSKSKASKQLDFGELRKCGMASVIINEDFDTTLIEKINKQGLKIIINLNSLSHSKNYYRNLESVVKKYGIEYLLFYSQRKENSDTVNEVRDEGIEELRSLIIRNNLIFFVMENKEQTGYTPISGIDSLIKDTNYSLSKAFTISNYSSKIKNEQDVKMMWLRAVMDRNIRLISIEPIFPEKDVIHTLELFETSKELSEILVKKGFVTNAPIKKVNTTIPGMPYVIMIIINLIVSMALFMDYSGIKKNWIILFLEIMPVLIVFLVFVVIMPENNIWAAYLASFIYPTLSSAVLLMNLKSPMENTFLLIFKVLLKLLAINGIGVCTVIAIMCDVRYTMSLINFNLVIPAFIIPLIVFNINFIIQGERPLYKEIINDVKNYGIIKFISSNLIYLFIGIVFLAIYLLRSGNFGVFPEFNAEIEFRKFLEITTSVRPRTKEFVIGYPSLFAFLYLYQKKVSYKLLSFLGTFSSIIGISIINSFCHGFTPVYISLIRTFNGLFLGLLTGCISLIICWFILKLKAVFMKRN